MLAGQAFYYFSPSANPAISKVFKKIIESPEMNVFYM
jgi:hypothetical protein